MEQKCLACEEPVYYTQPCHIEDMLCDFCFDRLHRHLEEERTQKMKEIRYKNPLDNLLKALRKYYRFIPKTL